MHLEVHHIKPYNLFPALELEPRNLITLCESSNKCHLLIGHLGDWHNWNPEVVHTAAAHLALAEARPEISAVHY